MLLEMFREIRSETGVHLYDAGDGNGVVAEGEILPQLSFPSGTSDGYVWDIKDASVVSTAVLCPSPRQRLAGYRFGFGLRVGAIAGRHAPKPCLNCSTLTSWWHCLLLSTSMWKQANDQRRLSDCPQKTSGRPFHQKGMD